MVRLMRLMTVEQNDMTDDDRVDAFEREQPGWSDRVELALMLGRKVTLEDWSD